MPLSYKREAFDTFDTKVKHRRMDKFSQCVVLLSLACLLQLSSQAEEKKYIAVVIEYRPDSNPFINVRDYEGIVSNIKGVLNNDIIIFPESTLTVKNEWASLVPDPKDGIIPYKNKTYNDFQAIQRMSKSAAENEAYIVINVLERENCTEDQEDCPKRGYFLYNTNVAFDRQGAVVARYRKVNVYDESVNKPKGQDLSTFTTDFGVSFGLITCFDILFKTPSLDLVSEKGIKHIIFPNRWYGELPFLTAAQVQGGWSYATNVTLFASGANNPPLGSTGTGIFFGRKSFLGYMYERAGTAFLHSDMLKTPKSPVCVKNENEATQQRSLQLLHDPSIPRAKKIDLDWDRTQFKKTACDGGLCCKFDIDYVSVAESSPEGYSYKAVAFQGERRFGKNMIHDVAYCAVVLCVKGNCAEKPSNGNFPLQFKKMNIQAEFKTNNTFQMPTTLTWKREEDGVRLLHLMDYDKFRFERKDIGRGNSLVTMELTSGNVKNLMTFGIFGRKFD